MQTQNTNNTFGATEKISSYPIVRFNESPTLSKPKKGTEGAYFKSLKMNVINNWEDFKKLLSENKDFIAADRDWNKNEEVGEWNTFYIDIDDEKNLNGEITTVKQPLQFYREIIFKNTGVYPVASWYSISSTENDRRQKHLILLDTIFNGGKDGENYKVVTNCINKLMKGLGIDYDISGSKPLRYCYAKNSNYEVIYSDPNKNKLDILKFREEDKIKTLQIQTVYPALGNITEINESLLEAIAKTHANNNDCEIHSYANLLGVLNWIRHIKQYDEETKDGILIPWIYSLSKDSEKSLILRAEKDFGSVPMDELEDLTAKFKDIEVLEYIYSFLKGKIQNEKFVKLLDLEGEGLSILNHYEMLDTFSIKEFKKCITRLDYLKQARIIELKKEEGEEIPLQITDDIIENYNISDRRPKGAKVMYSGSLKFDYVKGINLVTGVSHSGKSYFSIATTANLGYKTLYYSTDQDRDGFVQYCRTIKDNGGLDVKNLLVKNSMGTGLDTISKEIESYGIDCVVLDMITQIPVPNSDRMQDQELQRRQVEVLEELRNKYPNLIIIAVGSVPKGKDGQGEVTLETHTYGNNIIAHASDFITTIANNKENNKFIKILKDRYGDIDGHGRVNMETQPFQKITDHLLISNYR